MIVEAEECVRGVSPIAYTPVRLICLRAPLQPLNRKPRQTGPHIRLNKAHTPRVESLEDPRSGQCVAKASRVPGDEMGAT